MATQRRPRLGRRPGNRDTRGEILAAARNAFAGGGLGGVSLRGIATDAGVDVALIHHYFHSKEELFLASMQIPVPIHELVAPLVADGTGRYILKLPWLSSEGSNHKRTVVLPVSNVLG